MRYDRRQILGGIGAAVLTPSLGRAQSAAVYDTYPKPGTPRLANPDNSRRIVPAPAKDYWPFSGVNGAGGPVTRDHQDGGWVSNLSEVRYKGPTPRSYPTAAWDNADGGSAVKTGLLPAIRPIWDTHIRDTIICLGGDGYYYMTGSTGDNIWAFNDGIELWRSRDFNRWDYLGLVWSIERDGKWEKNWTMRQGVPFRAIWAPEIHFIGGNYYLCHCISGVGIGVLKSTSGKATGPYVHVLSDEPIKGGIDSTLFADDGRVYLSYGGGETIREIRPDFSGFAGDWQPMVFVDPDLNPDTHYKKDDHSLRQLGFEGVTLFKRDGTYYLGAADFYYGRYSFMFANSDKLHGPYRGRHEGPAGAGGGNIFRDASGQWWQTFFGNDDQMPFREKPGLIAIEFDADGKVRAKTTQPFAPYT